VQVQEVRLGQVLEGNKQYQVPLYQRPYSWTKQQHERLWGDIVELAEARKLHPKATHFTGSLVLAVGDVGPGSSNFLVVDGQQRLTTLTVLLCALRDHLREVEPDSPEVHDQLHELYLINKFKPGDSRLKLLPTQADRDAYRSMIDGQLDKAAESSLLSTYRFFRSKIRASDDPDDAQDMAQIQSAVLDGLVFVSITAGSEDNVYRIFESLNNTGLRLTQGDLLRNYIFMRLGTEGENLYDSTWLPMQDRLSARDLEALFWIDLTWINSEAKQGDIYALQQQRLEGLTALQIAAEVARYNQLSQLLATMRDPENSEKERDPSVRRALARLKEYGMPSTDPLVLRLLELRRSGAVTTGAVIDALAILESFLVRRLLVNAPHNALSRMMLRASDELDEKDLARSLRRYLSIGRKRYATDSQIVTALTQEAFYFAGKPQQRRTVLAWLEHELAGQEPANLQKSTIEHVMPQSLSEAWRTTLADDLGPFESVEELHETLVHSLANLTLSGYNPQLSNRPFAEKRPMLAESNIALNKRIAESESWNRSAIMKRGADLADLVAKTWVPPLDSDDDDLPGLAWGPVTDVVAAIPAGKWVSYGDAATVIGSTASALESFLSGNKVPYAWRVLRASGAVGSHKFSDPDDSGRTAAELLQADGLSLDQHGHAGQDHRLRAPDVASLLEVDLVSDLDADTPSEAPNADFFNQLRDRQPAGVADGVISVVDDWQRLGGSVLLGTNQDATAHLILPTAAGEELVAPFVISTAGRFEVAVEQLAEREEFASAEKRAGLLGRLASSDATSIGSAEDGSLVVSTDVLAIEDVRAAILDVLRLSAPA